MSEKKMSSEVLILLMVLVFILLFSYLSLNLKSIDFGYKMQELIQKENNLQEEINKLEAEKASLLNLERVEKIVIKQLGYQYPEPDQIIKVTESNHENK